MNMAKHFHDSVLAPPCLIGWSTLLLIYMLAVMSLIMYDYDCLWERVLVRVFLGSYSMATVDCLVFGFWVAKYGFVEQKASPMNWDQHLNQELRFQSLTEVRIFQCSQSTRRALSKPVPVVGDRSDKQSSLSLRLKARSTNLGSIQSCCA